jgi:hypothetical protein
MSTIIGNGPRLEVWRMARDTLEKIGTTGLRAPSERRGCSRCAQWQWTGFIPAMDGTGRFEIWSLSCGLTTGMRPRVVQKVSVICACHRTRKLLPTGR